MLYFVCFIFGILLFFDYFCNDFIVDFFTENKEIAIIIVIIIIIVLVFRQFRNFYQEICCIAQITWMVNDLNKFLIRILRHHSLSSAGFLFEYFYLFSQLLILLGSIFGTIDP